jgi:hypothetical protein
MMSDGFRSNRSQVIRAAFAECDQMDSERKELAAQHKARKRLLISELGVSVAQFDVMRKLEKLERDEAVDAIRDAYSLITPGQTVDWISAMGEPERPPASEETISEYSAPPRRRGRPPGSKNRSRQEPVVEDNALADDLPPLPPEY